MLVDLPLDMFEAFIVVLGAAIIPFDYEMFILSKAANADGSSKDGGAGICLESA